jgi:hypothetical protein
MNKREFQAILDRTGSSLMLAAEHLGIAKSTVSRWNERVPGYAEWYAQARLVMTEEQRAAIDTCSEKVKAGKVAVVGKFVMSAAPAEVLASVSPRALHAYLGQGWHKVKPLGDRGDLYSRDGAPDIAAPSSDHLADYVLAISQIVEILGSVEGRDPASVLRDLLALS